MIRIENNMEFDLKVPYGGTPKGAPPRFFTIPAAMKTEGEPTKPGILDLPVLDTITISRLRRHYERRPVDDKEPHGAQLEIGLMKIYDMPDEAAADAG